MVKRLCILSALVALSCLDPKGEDPSVNQASGGGYPTGAGMASGGTIGDTGSSPNTDGTTVTSPGAGAAGTATSSGAGTGTPGTQPGGTSAGGGSTTAPTTSASQPPTAPGSTDAAEPDPQGDAGATSPGTFDAQPAPELDSGAAELVGDAGMGGGSGDAGVDSRDTQFEGPQ